MTVQRLRLATRLYLIPLLAAAMVAGVLASPRAGAANANLVDNPNFTAGTTAWKVNDNNSTKFVTRTISGDSAAVLSSTYDDVTIALNDQVNTVQQGDAGVTYTVSAEVSSSLAKLSGQLRVREVLNGKVITHATTFYLESTAPRVVALQFTTTMTGANLDLNVIAWTVDRGREIYVDDVFMVAGAAANPGTPIAESPGFTLSDGCRLNARGIGSCSPLVGAAHGSNTDPKALEASLGQRLGVRRTYWGPGQVSSALSVAKADVAAGRIPWISFKLPYSWADMAAGKGDAWARDLTAKIAQVQGPVWVAFYHEPEGDGRIQDWIKMQERLGPIVRNGASNAAFSIILTGWNQWYGESQYRIANIWPNTKVDIAGFDVYCFYGTWKDGKYRTGDPSLKVAYFDKISAWAKTQGVAWGLAETGLTDAASADNPQWIQATVKEMKSTGGIALSYFDTTLNSDDSYHLSNAIKTKDFAAALKASPTFPRQ